MTKKWKVEDEKIWSEKIKAWKASGLTVTHFAEREGLCKSTLAALAQEAGRILPSALEFFSSG